MEIPKELEECFNGMTQKGEKKENLILLAHEDWIEDQEDAAHTDQIMAGSVKIYSSKEV